MKSILMFVSILLVWLLVDLCNVTAYSVLGPEETIEPNEIDLPPTETSPTITFEETTPETNASKIEKGKRKILTKERTSPE
jgi:hypothetical protein